MTTMLTLEVVSSETEYFAAAGIFEKDRDAAGVSNHSVRLFEIDNYGLPH